MASTKRIEYYRGDSYPLEITITEKSTGLAIDLTGYSFLMTIDQKENPPDSSTNLFNVVGVVYADQVVDKGKVSFTPTLSNTNQGACTNYYDIQMIDVSSNVRTIAKGEWVFIQDISK